MQAQAPNPAAAAMATQAAAGNDGGDDQNALVTFKYVYVPADPTQPLEERTLMTTRADECASLIDACKRHFRREQAASDASRAAHRQALLRQAAAAPQQQQQPGGGVGDHHQQQQQQSGAAGVPEAALQAALDMQMVEPIPLLSNTPANGYVAVNMYADDQASFKRAPVNARACGILRACGGGPMDVLGDVFIGRVVDDEETFQRLDFGIDELRSDAPWVAQAAQQAARRRERAGETAALMEQLRGSGAGCGGGAGGSSGGASASSRQALPPPPPETPADAAKARGNAAFTRGDNEAACEHYAAALQLDPGLTAARNNRALALLRLGRHADAEADATLVLEAEPKNVKALLRRAAARGALGKRAEQRTDLEAALVLQPQNKEAAEQLAALQAADATGEGRQQ